MENSTCPCRKKKCERHGNCDACRAHHANKKLRCACERHHKEKKSIFSFFKK